MYLFIGSFASSCFLSRDRKVMAVVVAGLHQQVCQALNFAL